MEFSKWFIIVLVITFSACIVAVLVRVDGREKADGLDVNDLSADDFEIIE